MPAKNVIKLYAENGYYHLYNRGVEKRIIFQDDQDYKVFLGYLKTLLEPPVPVEMRTITIGSCLFEAPRRPLNNFNKEIELLSYCLMPNHFHLLLKQNSNRSIESFTRSLLTRYSMYFNKRNERVGCLFQGTYKATLVENETYLLHLSRYIHLNPQNHLYAKYAKDTPLHSHYSSYEDYLGLRKTKWVNTDTIMSYFNNTRKTDLNLIDFLSYRSFVEDYIGNSEFLTPDLVLENNDT